MADGWKLAAVELAAESSYLNLFCSFSSSALPGQSCSYGSCVERRRDGVVLVVHVLRVGRDVQQAR